MLTNVGSNIGDILSVNVYHVSPSHLKELSDALTDIVPNAAKVEYIQMERLAYGTDVEIECTALVLPKSDSQSRL